MAKTSNELLAQHEALCAKAREVMRVKNQDYGATDDPYRNFRAFGRFGILVRLSDKLARLHAFEERGKFAVKDESVEDTALDAINYLILYLTYE